MSQLWSNFSQLLQVFWIRSGLASPAADLHICADDILNRAEVLLSTCAGAGDPLNCKVGMFQLGVLDEASQAIEPATLIPLVKGCRAALLVGDDKQLPPTILSHKASEDARGPHYDMNRKRQALPQPTLR